MCLLESRRGVRSRDAVLRSLVVKMDERHRPSRCRAPDENARPHDDFATMAMTTTCRAFVER